MSPIKYKAAENLSVWLHMNMQSCNFYLGLQVLWAAGVHVELQQFGQHVGSGHRLGVLWRVLTYLSDGPGCGRLDVVFGLLREAQGQLGHPLQDKRTHSTGERVQLAWPTYSTWVHDWFTRWVLLLTV